MKVYLHVSSIMPVDRLLLYYWMTVSCMCILPPQLNRCFCLSNVSISCTLNNDYSEQLYFGGVMKVVAIIYYFLIVKAKFQAILTVKVGSSENIVVIIKAPFIEAVLVGFWVFLPIFSSPKEEMSRHF